ncbi:BlaI/MecI/CopY family transcriptional regulator [Eubacteriales bacterium OttesenSCG-928-A19]|nr:BlaI/MecI/CopY family transcriptional regulator [Eubacteriales bacterium OttesenSCG-928-A19]
MKLHDSELKVMHVLWRYGETPAREIAEHLAQQVGWNINTSYTLIKRCMAKGAIERREPGFVCRALVECEKIRAEESRLFLEKLYDGSAELLFVSMVQNGQLSEVALSRLRSMMDEVLTDDGGG